MKVSVQKLGGVYADLARPAQSPAFPWRGVRAFHTPLQPCARSTAAIARPGGGV